MEKAPVLEKSNYSNDRPVADQAQLEQEQVIIVDLINKNRDRLESHFKSTNNEDFRKSPWNTLIKRQGQIAQSGNSLIKKIAESKNGDDALKSGIPYVIRTAENLMLKDCVRKLDHLAKKYNFFDIYQPISESMEINLFSSLNLKIGGISMMDISEGDVRPIEYFKTLMQADRALEKNKYEEYITENIDNPINKYPCKSKEAILYTCKQISIMSLIDPVLFIVDPLPELNETETEIFSKAKGISQKISGIRKTLFYKSLFNPNEPEFPILENILKEYLKTDDTLLNKNAILLKLGIFEKKSLFTAYRESKNLAKTNTQYADFYSNLAGNIGDFVRTFFKGDYIYTDADIGSFFDQNNKTENVPLPTFQDIKKIIGQTFSISSKPEYEVDPKEINLHGFLTPEKILVKFSPTAPNIFTVLLHYKDNKNEDKILSIGMSTKKTGEFFWDFLEDPNDPKMEQIKNASWLCIQSALLNVQKQAETAYREKQKAKAFVFSTSAVQNSPKKNHQEPYVPREKFVKPESQKPITPIKEALQSEILQSVEKNSMVQIDLPEDIEAMRPKNIPSQQWEQYIEKIRRYNKNNGVGSIELLKSRPDEKFRTFRLRVDKHLRAIVTEVHGNGHDGKEHYSIQQVLKRNNEYREI